MSETNVTLNINSFISCIKIDVINRDNEGQNPIQ